MRPKGKLFALLAVFVAIGLVTASGAFTTVEATRTVDVKTSGDGSALLALSGNHEYASGSGSGALQLDLGNSSIGLNPDATTRFDALFTITNQGNQAVAVSISKSSLGDLSSSDVVMYTNGDSTNTTIQDGTLTLQPGSSLTVGMEIDTSPMTTDSVSFDITINADAEST